MSFLNNGANATTGRVTKKRYYSDEKKLAAVQLYVVLGSMAEVSRQTGIHASSLSDWKQQEWWDRSLSEARRDHERDLDGRFTAIIDKAASEVMDRLEHGDEKTTSKGVRYRQKVSAKEASVVASIFFDKRQISRSLPTSINGSQDSGIKDMMLQFRKIAGQLDAKTIDRDGNIIEPDPDE